MRRSLAPSAQRARTNTDPENTPNGTQKPSPASLLEKPSAASLELAKDTSLQKTQPSKSLAVGMPLNSTADAVPSRPKIAPLHPSVSKAPPSTALSKTVKVDETKQVPSSAAAAPPKHYYTVLYCKMSSKKHKSYNDGVLECSDRNSVLYDMDGKVISKQLGKTDKLKEGQTWKVSSYECEIAHVVSEEEFTSGRVFINKGKIVKEAPPVPSSVSSLSKMQFKSVGRDKSDAGDTVLKIEPKHDPNTPGAIILNKGHPEFDGKGYQIVSVVVDPYISNHLRPHQVEGVQFMYDCITGNKVTTGRGCILADEMGLGKSLQSISILWTLLRQSPSGGCFVKKAMVVCPSSLVNNWGNEMKKWLGPERIKPILILSNEKANDANIKDFVKSPIKPVIIISYEMLRKYEDELKSVQNCLMICDEGHRLKNAYGNKTIQSLNAINTNYRVILTGTPVQNDLEEFYAMVNFVNPGALGALAGFKRIFADAIVKSRDPSSSFSEQELGRQRSEELSNITSQFILRRTSDILKKYLPPKTEMAIFCRASSAQTSLYKRYLQSKEITQILTGNQGSVLFFITALKKLCNHPDLVLDSGEEGDGVRARKEPNEHLRKPPNGYEFGRVEHSGKLQVLVELLRSAREKSSDRFVVVSNYTTTLDYIGKVCKGNGFSCLRLDGSTEAKERQSLVNRFNTPGTPETVFLLSARAGGVGLNLIGANRLVLFDPDWNPATDLQAMARVWRDGQKKTVFIYRFFTTGSLEEKIYQRQLSKQDIGKVVVEEKLQKGQFSRDDLRELFAYRDTLRFCDTYDLIRSGKNKGFISAAHSWTGDGWEASVADELLKPLLGSMISYVHCVSSDERDDHDILKAETCVIDEDGLETGLKEGGDEDGDEEAGLENPDDGDTDCAVEHDTAAPAKKRRMVIDDDDDDDGDGDDDVDDDDDDTFSGEKESKEAPVKLPSGFDAIDSLDLDGFD